MAWVSQPPSHPHRFSTTSPPSSAPTPPARSGHYRPFSTLYTESPYVEFRDKSTCIKRYSSIGGLQAFAHMGIGFKDKAKAKKTISPPVADPVEIKPCTPPPRLPPPPPSPHCHYNARQRPSTSSGLINPTPTLHCVKKKRSMASLFVPTDSSSSGSIPPSPDLQLLSSPPRSADVSITNSITVSISKRTRFSNQGSNATDDHDSSNKFVPKNIWAKRHNMKLHPYHHDAPYMQAYDPILLDSDRYSDLLLQRLTNGSPSFHDYGKKPPATVLDLGCGPGHWVLRAASVWKTSQITGLDLVDVTLPGFETTENAHFVLGNFLTFQLPFPDNSFEYVRMANLVLCIPYEKWDYVLTEVRRVLTIHGKMELVDDQIFFPYGTAPKPPSPSWSRDMFDAFDGDSEEDKETLQGTESDTSSTLNVSNSSCEEKPRQIAESPTIRPIVSYSPPTPVEKRSSASLSPDAALDSESRHVSWHSQATASRELEAIFEIMLKQKYKIFPRPSDFVLNRMEYVFGSDAAGKTRSYHIKLAPVDSAYASSGSDKAEEEETVNLKSNGVTSHFDGFSMKKAWMGDKESKKEKKLKKANKDSSASKADTSTGSGSGSSSERSSLENPIVISRPSTFVLTPVPLSTSTKAAGRLGIDFASSPPKETTPSPPLPLHLDQAQAPAVSAKAAGRLGISYSDLALASCLPKDKAPPPPVPLHSDRAQAPVVSAKAAGRLGISYSDLAVAAADSAHRRPGKSLPSSSPLQSPGLLVWPSTYIPVTPAELEMHANKYVHTLLGCKPALADFIARFVDEDGTRFVDDDEFHEVMWKYECFRRSRFNWPSEIPDPYDDEPDPALPTPIFAPPLLKSKSGSKSNKISSDSSSNGLYHGEELTHIRTIRVFEATKSDDRSLASLLFHHKTSPTL